MNDTNTTCACGAAPASSCTGGSSSNTQTKTSTTSKTIQNGKGDAPRNISPRFRENFDLIDWGNSKRKNKIAA